MHDELAKAVKARRDETAQAWALRVQQSSERYRGTTTEELAGSLGDFIDGLIDVLTTGNYEAIEECLIRVAEQRAGMGFDPMEVQRGLLMGCETILPALQEAFESDARRLVWSVTQVERVMQRSVQLLNQSFEEFQTKEAQVALEALAIEGAAAQNRLQAVLEALDCGALVVNSDLVVVWADERAASPQFGMTTPGDAHMCAIGEGGDSCLLAAARNTGEIQRAEPQEPCRIHLAIPVKSAEGEVVEVVGLMR